MSYLFQVTAMDKHKKVFVTTFPNKELAQTYAASVKGKVKRVSGRAKVNVSVTKCVKASMNMQKVAEKAFERAIMMRAEMREKALSEEKISKVFATFMERQAARKIENEKARVEKLVHEQEQADLELALGLLDDMSKEYENERKSA